MGRQLPQPQDQRIAKLVEQRKVMFDYLLLRVELQDMHGIQDAASDIREIDAKLAILRENQ
jgi:hypothetical protein